MNRFGQNKAWTQEKAIEVGLVRCNELDRPLRATDLGQESGIPSISTVVNLFGTIADYNRALGRTDGLYKPRTGGLGHRKCLRCDKPFRPQHEGLRICNPCKASVGREGAGEWMNNEAVIEVGDFVY